MSRDKFGCWTGFWPLANWWQHYEPFTGWSLDVVLDALGVSLSVVFLPEGPSRLRDTDRERTTIRFSSRPPAYQPPVKQPNLALTPAQTSTRICQHWFLQSAHKQLTVCTHTHTQLTNMLSTSFCICDHHIMKIKQVNTFKVTWSLNDLFVWFWQLQMLNYNTWWNT